MQILSFCDYWSSTPSCMLMWLQCTDTTSERQVNPGTDWICCFQLDLHFYMKWMKIFPGCWSQLAHRIAHIYGRNFFHLTAGRSHAWCLRGKVPIALQLPNCAQELLETKLFDVGMSNSVGHPQSSWVQAKLSHWPKMFPCFICQWKPWKWGWKWASPKVLRCPAEARWLLGRNGYKNSCH